MNQPSFVWLASYPRSGNTMLRTILWNCFGLKSASIYPQDLGNNQQLENHVGHIERDHRGKINFLPNSIPLVKTHEYPSNNNPAIYVVRDGRAAAVSLWQFYQQTLPLQEIITGNHRFGLWSKHVQQWNPKARPNTLLLEYESMIQDPRKTLEKISNFLNFKIINDQIPNRDAMADGKWVKKKGNWQQYFSTDLANLFDQVNGTAMSEMGYISHE